MRVWTKNKKSIHGQVAQVLDAIAVLLLDLRQPLHDVACAIFFLSLSMRNFKNIHFYSTYFLSSPRPARSASATQTDPPPRDASCAQTLSGSSTPPASWRAAPFVALTSSWAMHIKIMGVGRENHAWDSRRILFRASLVSVLASLPV